MAIRVFLVDDSPLARAILKSMLSRGTEVEVVGESGSGAHALRQVPRVAPDVVLMDMLMPELDGLATTRELMATSPRPIIIVSDLVGHDAGLNFRALQSGALDLFRKPTASDRDDPRVLEELVRKIRVVAGVPVVTRRRKPESQARSSPAPPEPQPAQAVDRVVSLARPPLGGTQLALVGASTGGPIALERLLGGLRGRLGCPMLVVQHMAEGFTAGLAEWLATASGIPVSIARGGEIPRAGQVYLAPERIHLGMRDGRVHLREERSSEGHCPSVDVLFESAAQAGTGPRTVAALLTGMGSDGARGLLALREAGAWTIAQDRESCVVYGMPKAAVELGAACEELSPERLAERIALATRPEATSPR